MTTDDVRISIVIVGSTGVIDGVIVIITVETTGGGEEGGGEEGGGEGEGEREGEGEGEGEGEREGEGEGEGEGETEGSVVKTVELGNMVELGASGSRVVDMTNTLPVVKEDVSSDRLVMTVTDWAWQYVVAMATSNSKSFASDVLMVIFPRACVCVCVFR